MVTAQSGMMSSPEIEPLGGRYRVLELTQSDQLGVVYRASDMSAGEAPRLVRVWLRSLAQDPEFRAQLRRRSARLAILAAQQPALPRLFSLEDTADGHLLVTDYVEGRSLGDWLSTPPPLDMRATLQLAIRLGEAIEAVHNAGFVHGYLAPAHVEICEPDQQVRLNGFEYAAIPPRLLSQLDFDAPPFSRHHLAPEHQGGQEITEADDIYAYGCLVRDLLMPVRLARRLPAGVDRTVQAALASDPADRPRAIGEALNDLWGELTEPAAGTGRRPLARRAALAALLATLVVAGASLWAVHKSSSRATAEPTARSPVVQEQRPVDVSAATPLAAPVVEPAVVPPPSPPEPPRSLVTEERPVPMTAPTRPVESAPPRPAITERPAERRPARTQARTPDADAGAVRGQPRPGSPVPEPPRDAPANPRQTVGDRPPRPGADDSQAADPGSIIDWLLNDSRAGRL